MTALQIPAGGQAVWRVTSSAGTRYLRTRADGLPVPLPAGAHAQPACWADADEFAAAAPAGLRDLWQLAEASQPRYGWQLWQLGPAAGPDAWTLRVDPPDGTEHRYTWVRRGDRMEPACAVQIIRRALPAASSAIRPPRRPAAP